MPKAKTKTVYPKRIWIRSLKNGRISVGEYVCNKYRTIVPPFPIDPHSPEHKKQIATLQLSINSYQRNTSRPLVAVISRDDYNAKHIADALTIPLE